MTPGTTSAVSLASLQDLRRIADAVGQLRDRTVQDVVIRSDCRQLRITLEDGQSLLISVLLDEAGKTRLDAGLARAAREGGCRFAIGSDGHRATQLAGMRFGVMQARRGWVPAASVVNTWPREKLFEWLQSRRRGPSRIPRSA